MITPDLHKKAQRLVFTDEDVEAQGRKEQGYTRSQRWRGDSVEDSAIPDLDGRTVQ